MRVCRRIPTVMHVASWLRLLFRSSPPLRVEPAQGGHSGPPFTPRLLRRLFPTRGFPVVGTLSTVPVRSVSQARREIDPPTAQESYVLGIVLTAGDQSPAFFYGGRPSNRFASTHRQNPCFPTGVSQIVSYSKNDDTRRSPFWKPKRRPPYHPSDVAEAIPRAGPLINQPLPGPQRDTPLRRDKAAKVLPHIAAR